MSLNKSASIILRDCMALKKNESCLIVTDKKLKSIGELLFRKSLKICKKSKLIFTNIPKSHGSEPPQNVAEEMLNYDVILLPTTKSLSHTRARNAASKTGARIASMPGITEGMMQRTLNVNFYKIRKTNNNLISKLKNRNKIKITTKEGTDIEFNLNGRKWQPDGGIYTKRSAFGNLPSGEIFIAPLEGKTNGKIVCDASVGGLGRVDKNIEIIVGSVRSPENVKLWGKSGAHILTIPPEVIGKCLMNARTKETVVQFLNDANKAMQSL